MLDGWAAWWQLKATNQEETPTPPLNEEWTYRWDGDDWLDAWILCGCLFCFIWLTLDVATCLNAYEALGPMAGDYNPKCS